MFAPLTLDPEQKLVVRELWRHGPQSRIQLAARLQISPAAMTKMSRSLLALGLVQEAEAQIPAARGRPAIPLRISPTGGYSVGATLHRNMLEIVLLNYAGGIIATLQEHFDDPDPRRFAKVLGRRIHQLTEQHQLLGSRLLGVGVGVPGSVYASGGDRWHTVESLSGWRDVSLREVLSDLLALPVWIENDANAAAIAEYHLGGLARRCATTVVILLGHGIGAGVIDNGWLLRGQMGNAGEIGCLYPLNRPRPSTLDLLETLRAQGCEISSISRFEEQANGQSAVVEAWAIRAARQLELVVNGALAWFDPGEIVLSGPLPPSVLDQVAQHLRKGDLIGAAHRDSVPDISVSSLGGAATTLGAALLPINDSAAIIGGYGP